MQRKEEGLKTSRTLGYISIILSLVFVPGAIPAWSIYISQKLFSNPKMIYSPIMMLSTIFILSGVAC